jgi:hypothetical protein
VIRNRQPNFPYQSTGESIVKPTLIAAVTIGATAILVTTVGCGGKSSTAPSTEASSSKAPSSTSASSTAAAEQDYSKLLIGAGDIAAPGDTFTAQEPTLNPGGKPGVATVFANGGDTREIGDTIFVLPDADTAGTALKGAVDALGASVTGGTPEPAQVGSAATMVSGTSPDGSKAITVLVFTEGTAFTTLEFDSGPDDPVPPEFVLDVAGKQDEAIKAGLGG